MEFQSIGRSFIIIGFIIICVGAAMMFFHKIPLLGKLPGDIYIKRESFSFYFPLTTSILVSLLLRIVLRFFQKR